MVEIIGGKLFDEQHYNPNKISYPEIQNEATRVVLNAVESMMKYDPECPEDLHDNLFLRFQYSERLLRGVFHNLVVDNIPEDRRELYDSRLLEISLENFTMSSFLALDIASESVEELARFFFNFVQFSLGDDDLEFDNNQRKSIITHIGKKAINKSNQIFAVFRANQTS